MFVDEFFFTKNIFPTTIEALHCIYKKLLLQALDLVTYIHTEEVHRIDVFLCKILHDSFMFTKVGRLHKQIINSLRFTNKMLSAHVSKLYLNVEINKQIASIDDGIVENRGPAAKVAPLFNVFHREIDTIPIVEQHHFLHITCVDETFDV